MYKFLLLLLALALLLPGTAGAQGDDELQCDDTDISTIIDTVLSQLQEAKSQEASTALASIVEIRRTLAELDARCLGLAFTGTAATVHGPVYVPEGIFRTSVTTQDFFIMTGVVLEGECGDSYEGEFIVFNEFGGGEFTAETIFRSEGCSALLETSNIFAPYTVTFEKVR